MKARVERLEGGMRDLSEEMDQKFKGVESEIDKLRKFKHDANGHIHSHNGKLNLIESQQTNMVAALNKLTTVVEDAVQKIGGLMTLKSMMIGAGIVFVPTVTGMFFLFQWYLKSKGIE